MTREELVKLKFEYRTDLVLYNLINTIIGECDRKGKNCSEDQIITIMKKMYNNNLETIGKIEDVVDREYYLAENDFIKQYLPETLTDDELRNKITICIYDDNMSRGEIMKYLKDNYNGRYDGKKANEIFLSLSK